MYFVYSSTKDGMVGQRTASKLKSKGLVVVDFHVSPEAPSKTLQILFRSSKLLNPLEITMN